jgi:formyltetrahydrofolate synthetase
VIETVETSAAKLPLLPITAIARKLGLRDDDYDQLGPQFAKLHLDLLRDPARPPRGKLILVTATTPTASGEGKTVTSIGLVQGLEHLGKKAIITSREPSLGPVFGMKGGAAGGGLSQIEPSEKVNLHFTGDFHAITSAHNLLAALIDAHLFHGNALNLDPANIWWPRAMDMNDRALRRISVEVDGKRDGANRNTGFVITAASEIMAILALAKDRADLRRRLAAIVIGATRNGNPVRAADLNATGAMMALLADAILPNLVQTTEGTPALVHAGPFGNIAHGTSSIIAQQIGLRLADYVVNECGFAADLGAEKYIDIVMGVSGVSPSPPCSSPRCRASAIRAKAISNRASPTSLATSGTCSALAYPPLSPSTASLTTLAKNSTRFTPSATRSASPAPSPNPSPKAAKDRKLSPAPSSTSSIAIPASSRIPSTRSLTLMKRSWKKSPRKSTEPTALPSAIPRAPN